MNKLALCRLIDHINSDGALDLHCWPGLQLQIVRDKNQTRCTSALVDFCCLKPRFNCIGLVQVVDLIVDVCFNLKTGWVLFLQVVEVSCENVEITEINGLLILRKPQRTLSKKLDVSDLKQIDIRNERQRQ